ncbi:M6 family metalloprotease domain-containing protein [Marinihelvus fidelis]|uniref:M6 family metalloprotease domain-containing protein n=1 Tax=Marinihelvus fidelis TaxID=2613842 RepID=A0A5N0THG2_9GAMM|nr:M6 family metalloprotease domain-containing protein [Marinihelvus fidelis]KAA9132739.1 M6 family metalloprotease domain-containing protein [Marinihelvus fidelis]
MSRTVSARLRAGLLVFACTFVSGTAFAAPASPKPFQEVQPDGSVITLYVRGDEHFNWMEDTQGYTVVRNGRWFEYGQRGASGRVNPNGLVVGRDNPRAAGLGKRVMPSAAVRGQSALRVNGQVVNQPGSAAPDAIAPLGTVKNLVVLIRFADHVGRSLPSVSDMDVLFNSIGGDPSLAPTGSIRDVYFENSYGQLDLVSDINPGIGGWITVSQSEAYYANGNSGDSTLWQALREALDDLDDVIDFGDYDTDNDGRIDSIAFIHSGYGAEWGGSDAYGASQANRIWSHRWAIQPQWNSNDGVSVYDYHISPGVWGTSGSAIGRIGVIAHETGHFFGLPDLYDTSGSGEGIGSWGLMANSWDFNGSQLCPPHFSPWSKTNLGWYTPTVISDPGEYTLRQAESFPDVYRIDQGFPSNEYLLVENRQDAGFDCSIPQGGLVIWHIDNEAGYNTEGFPGQSGWPANGNHYRVAVLQADGDYDLERSNNRGDSTDAHHAAGVDAIGPGPGNHPNTDTYQDGIIASTGITISDISASSASMTFCLNGCAPPVPPADPSGFSASAASASRIDLAWSDNADNENGYRLERSPNGSSGWSVIASLGANTSGYSDTGLAASTTYFYRVAAFNGAGDSAYAGGSATTDAPPPFVDYTAVSQSNSEGSVSGGIGATHDDDGNAQSITEQQSGGNPRKRRSSLSHTWVFDIEAGNSTTLTANAWSGGSSDNDDFQFQWSADGSSYTNAFVVSSTNSANTQVAALPGGLSGSVWVRVIDTDNSQGNSAQDTVHVDQLVIRVDNTPVTPPVAPSGLGTSAVAHDRVDIGWTDNAGDETGYEVQRANGGGFSTVATLGANTTAWSDTGVSAETTYSYRVRALKGAETSAWSNTASATTPEAPAQTLSLSANGFKVKGRQQVDLNWSGSTAASVDIYRDGSLLTTTANDGFHNDNIGAKGGATYQYQVCNAGTSTCSGTVTVVF